MQVPQHETVHAIIKGVVQGVGYRHATVRRAHMLGVTGWVQNMEDGTVQAMVQGTPDQVDHMLQWLHRGPPSAVVKEVITERIYADKQYKRFEQL
ncbi:MULTISPECIES: acylphosphatase [unclassified Bordetella]|uniref:acylphosphatase n=1 Tax=unclassified Bordetella TaxID=2630031 RepID=UPI001329ABC5|nr:MULTISPECIES: acylphosphatase [unclassified Bordetella]MVW71299.1 acylphosphatase [Bordetella sp. 15P40C-2]MVW78676.1 acylphosphatase [Bordetella sp. 02P26C-1]